MTVLNIKNTQIHFELDLFNYQLFQPMAFELAATKRVGSSSPDVFCKNDVLRNFAKFRGKHLCQSLFFNEDARLAK